MIERGSQFQPAATDIRHRFPDRERRINGGHLSGFLQPLLAGKDLPGQNQRLSFRARLGQTAQDQ